MNIASLVINISFYLAIHITCNAVKAVPSCCVTLHFCLSSSRSSGTVCACVVWCTDMCDTVRMSMTKGTYCIVTGYSRNSLSNYGLSYSNERESSGDYGHGDAFNCLSFSHMPVFEQFRVTYKLICSHWLAHRYRLDSMHPGKLCQRGDI